MKKKKWKKILLWSVASVLFLFIVLCLHIYFVMRPSPPGPNTVAMARIDFKQDINNNDASKITTWLYQHGADHVLCNAATNIAVFTFHPAKQDANNIINTFKASTHYNAVRYLPSAKEMSAGCPVAATSFSYKIYNFMSNIF